MSIGGDVFIRLSNMASSENWCWNVTCGTCGCFQIRCAIWNITKNVMPYDELWEKELDKSSEQVSGLWRREQLPLLMQGNLHNILSEVDVAEASSRCRFPDWLGHLGIMMLHCEKLEGIKRSISINLSIQFKAILSRNKFSHSSKTAIEMLDEILNSDSKILVWQNLEAIEAGLKSSYLPNNRFEPTAP